MITGTSSLVNRTSVSQKFAPTLDASRNALRVFSTYRSTPPRWATTPGVTHAAARAGAAPLSRERLVAAPAAIVRILRIIRRSSHYDDVMTLTVRI